MEKIIISFLLLSVVLLCQIENVSACRTDPAPCVNAENGGCCPDYRCVKDECGKMRCLYNSRNDWWPGDKAKIKQACLAEKDKARRDRENQKRERNRCLDYVKGGRGSGVIADAERTCKNFDFTMNEVYETKPEDGGNVTFPYMSYHKTYWENVWDRLQKIGSRFQSYYDKLAKGDLRVLIEILNDISDPSSFVSEISGEGGVMGKAKDGVEKLGQLYQHRKG